MIIYWNNESNNFIKSILTAGTNCTITSCSHVERCARETFRIHSKWTRPVGWDWLLVSAGRSDWVGAVSGSPPHRYTLCKEAAPLRAITHTSVCDRHDTCSKAWLLRPCVSCWPDSWALKKVCPGGTQMNAQGEEKLMSTLRLGAMLPPTGTTLNTLSLLWFWVSVGCRNKRFWYNIKNLKSINITLVLTFNMVPFFLKK